MERIRCIEGIQYKCPNLESCKTDFGAVDCAIEYNDRLYFNLLDNLWQKGDNLEEALK